MGASLGRSRPDAGEEQRVVNQASESPRQMVQDRCCATCARFLPAIGKCAIAKVTDPVSGVTLGGNPGYPASYVGADRARMTPYPLSDCGPGARLWEAIF